MAVPEVALTPWPRPAIPAPLDFAGVPPLSRSYFPTEKVGVSANVDKPGGRPMLGKRIIQGVIVLAAFGLTGCCRWCERHCFQPAASCCQPAAPKYAPAPAAYQAPGCCPASPQA